jgi:hypothetical protein
MPLIAKIFIAFFLLLIAYQDFKQREISWYSIPALIGSFLYTSTLIKPFNDIWIGLLFNVGFILLQLLLLTGYLSVKNKKLVNIVNSYLGIGDILFFTVLAVAFSPVNFIVFYIVSCLLTIVGYGIYSTLRKKRKDIPLAGAMACIVLLLMGLNFLIPNWNFQNDEFLANILNK